MHVSLKTLMWLLEFDRNARRAVKKYGELLIEREPNEEIICSYSGSSNRLKVAKEKL
jgi:hypothetical protein